MIFFRLLCAATFFHPDTADGRRMPAGTVIMKYTDSADEDEEFCFWLPDETGWYRSHLDEWIIHRISALELLAMEAE